MKAKHAIKLFAVQELLLLFACTTNPLIDNDVIGSIKTEKRPFREVTTQNDVVIGKKIDNTYSVEHVNIAYKEYCDLTKQPYGDEIKPTHMYVRFLPQNKQEYDFLLKEQFDMYSFPLNYEIIRNGTDYYDSSAGDNSYTWQYANVPIGYSFNKIKYEILDYCIYASDIDPDKRISIAYDMIKNHKTRAMPRLLLPPETEGGGGSSGVTYSGYLKMDNTSIDADSVRPISNAKIIIRHGTNVQYTITELKTKLLTNYNDYATEIYEAFNIYTPA